jgi:hypothetical protein
MTATDVDVAAGFQSLWAAAELAALVPGGLHWEEDGVPATTEPPYAVFRVKPGARMTTAGALYVETFGVNAEVYATNPAARAATLRALAAIDRCQAAWPGASGACVMVKPGRYEPPAGGDRTAARDVFVLRLAWDVALEQTRSPIGVP